MSSDATPAISPPDRTISFNGLELACDDRNPAASGAPLLLVHGYTGGRADFADVIDRLAATRRVVAWDHRGHQDSTNTGDAATYTFAQLADDMAVAIDVLGLAGAGPIDIVGHSMGGIVTMLYALDHPESVRSLVLMDTLASPNRMMPQEIADMLVASARNDGMPAIATMIAGFLESMPVAPTPEAKARVIERARYKTTNMDVEAYEHLGNALSRFDPIVDRVAAFTCPVTVLVGENDIPLRPAADELHAAIPQSNLVVIPNAAHSPQDENPDAWLAAIEAHLAAVASQASG